MILIMHEIFSLVQIILLMKYFHHPQVADEWRLISQERKRNYEARAQRYNTEEDRKWRQRMAVQQRNRGVPFQPGQTRPRGGGMVGRGGGGGGGGGGPIPVQSRPVAGNPVYRPRGGGYNVMRNSGQNNQSGLVISSVSSLSSAAANNTFNLPKVTTATSSRGHGLVWRRLNLYSLS